MFCPKFGYELKEMKTEFDFSWGRYGVSVVSCERCQLASVVGADELGLRGNRYVEQNIGTVEDGSTVTGIVIGSVT